MRNDGKASYRNRYIRPKGFEVEREQGHAIWSGATMMTARQHLAELTQQFMTAFNKNDLDTVMSFFAEESVYDEFNGTHNAGKEAIRAAFTPQFTGQFGQMQFLDDDLFIDAETGKVMASWRCTLEVKGQPTSWRGLDLLHFQDDKLVRKLTYAKAKIPLFSDSL